MGCSMLTLDYDVMPCTGDYSLKLGLLSLRYPELVTSLPEIIEKDFSFCRGNVQILRESLIERPVYF